MIVGVPKEVKDHETRVGLVPSGVIALREAGHRVLVETNAGAGSSLPDQDYRDAGAEILANGAEVWSKADLVVKVKEPQPSEYPHFRGCVDRSPTGARALSSAHRSQHALGCRSRQGW